MGAAVRCSMRLLLPLLRVHMRPLLVKKLRASAVCIASCNFAVGWTRHCMRSMFKKRRKVKVSAHCCPNTIHKHNLQAAELLDGC